MRRVVFDTNLYVDWMSTGAHEALLHRQDDVRYLSAVVLMELRAGATTRRADRALDRLRDAFEAHGRLLSPNAADLDVAGRALRKLRSLGFETRRGAAVNDVLIALAARSVGAWLVSRDSDLAQVRRAIDFHLVVVGAERAPR